MITRNAVILMADKETDIRVTIKLQSTDKKEIFDQIRDSIPPINKTMRLLSIYFYDDEVKP